MIECAFKMLMGAMEEGRVSAHLIIICMIIKKMLFIVYFVVKSFLNIFSLFLL